MNRFFSKLNLADIKIKAEGNSFPPDADEEETPEVVAETQEETATTAAAAATEPVEEAPGPELSFGLPSEPENETDASVPVESNGHNPNGFAYEESTALYSTTSTTESEGEVTTTRVTEIVSDGIVIGIGEVLKVSARSRPSAVAGAIAGVVREAGKAEVQAIGAGATNQAIKAVAIARDYLNESGIEAVCVPAFIDVTIENEDRTAIRLVVEPR